MMPLLENRVSLERDWTETGQRLERNQQDTKFGAMADDLIQTNKVPNKRARESQRELEKVRELERATESWSELE